MRRRNIQDLSSQTFRMKYIVFCRKTVSCKSVRSTFTTVANIGSHIIPINKEKERENLIRKIREESDQVYPWGQESFHAGLTGERESSEIQKIDT